jgi:hypothetical protein
MLRTYDRVGKAVASKYAHARGLYRVSVACDAARRKTVFWPNHTEHQSDPTEGVRGTTPSMDLRSAMSLRSVKVTVEMKSMDALFTSDVAALLKTAFEAFLENTDDTRYFWIKAVARHADGSITSLAAWYGVHDGKWRSDVYNEFTDEGTLKTFLEGAVGMGAWETKNVAWDRHAHTLASDIRRVGRMCRVG